MSAVLHAAGITVAEGEIVEWKVKEGDAVKEDQVFLEVMTDKATVEITAPVTGTILTKKAEEGNIVFEAHRLVDDPDRFFVYEVYRDEDAFQAHLHAPAGISRPCQLTLPVGCSSATISFFATSLFEAPSRISLRISISRLVRGRDST